MDSEVVRTDEAAEVQFQAVEPVITQQLFCSKDYRVWVMPHGLNIATGCYVWTMWTFLRPEWYDPEAPGTVGRFLYRIPVAISAFDMMNGANASGLIRYVLGKLEAQVEAMNRDGVLHVMEDDPDYRGPLSIRGITMEADPTFAEKLYAGVQ